MSDLDALQGEVDRLNNAVAHLVRSNSELRETMQENGRDPDFKQAIEENIVTIAKYRTNIEGLEKVLKEARGEGVALTHSEAGGGGGTGPNEQQGAGSPGSGAQASEARPASDGEGGMWL